MKAVPASGLVASLIVCVSTLAAVAICVPVVSVVTIVYRYLTGGDLNGAFSWRDWQDSGLVLIWWGSVWFGTLAALPLFAFPYSLLLVFRKANFFSALAVGLWGASMIYLLVPSLGELFFVCAPIVAVVAHVLVLLIMKLNSRLSKPL